MEKGYLRVYTGNGKGKTTMALGIALRVAGEGRRVFFGQFIKDDPKGDIYAIRRALPGAVTAQFGCGSGCIAGREPDSVDRACAKKGLERCKAALLSGNYGIVVMDEVTIPMYFGLISEEEINELISLRPQNCELVLTGRYASQSIMDKADILTILDSPRLPDEVPQR